MAPCCFPALGVAGSALGLTALAPSESHLLHAVQGLAVLSAVGGVFSYLRHHKIPPLALGLLGAAVVVFAVQSSWSSAVAYGGLTALAIAALWNTFLAKRRSGETVALQSTLTCPHCGARSKETMPLNACQHFFRCTSCQALLKPLDGDCCVFCSFGDVKCPPKQHEACCPTAV